MIHAADPRNFGAVARLVLPGSLLRSHPLQLMPRSALPGYHPPKGWSTAQVLRLSAWPCRGPRSHVRTASRTSHLYCHCHRRVFEIGVYGCLQPGEDKHESHHELTDQSFFIAPPQFHWSQYPVYSPSIIVVYIRSEDDSTKNTPPAAAILDCRATVPAPLMTLDEDIDNQRTFDDVGSHDRFL